MHTGTPRGVSRVPCPRVPGLHRDGRCAIHRAPRGLSRAQPARPHHAPLVHQSRGTNLVSPP